MFIWLLIIDVFENLTNAFQRSLLRRLHEAQQLILLIMSLTRAPYYNSIQL